jgi:hypothetical protein
MTLSSTTWAGAAAKGLQTIQQTASITTDPVSGQRVIVINKFDQSKGTLVALRTKMTGSLALSAMADATTAKTTALSSGVFTAAIYDPNNTQLVSLELDQDTAVQDYTLNGSTKIRTVKISGSQTGMVINGVNYVYDQTSNYQELSFYNGSATDTVQLTVINRAIVAGAVFSNGNNNSGGSGGGMTIDVTLFYDYYPN